MNQFSDAIRAGIESALVAESNIKEILAALAEVSEAVQELTEGKVSIVKGKVLDEEEPNPFSAALVAAAVMGLGKSKLVDVVLAKRKIAPHTQIELARMDMPSSGYPCTLRFDKGKYTCHDKEAWVKLLKDLLASPDAGKAILKLQHEAPASK